jgi:hypothetical protein
MRRSVSRSSTPASSSRSSDVELIGVSGPVLASRVSEPASSDAAETLEQYICRSAAEGSQRCRQGQLAFLHEYPFPSGRWSELHRLVRTFAFQPGEQYATPVLLNLASLTPSEVSHLAPWVQELRCRVLDHILSSQGPGYSTAFRRARAEIFASDPSCGLEWCL